MMRRYDVKYMPVKNGTILSSRDGFASVFKHLLQCRHLPRTRTNPEEVLPGGGGYEELGEWLDSSAGREISLCDEL